MPTVVYQSHRECSDAELRRAKRYFKQKKWSLPPTAEFWKARVTTTGNVLEIEWLSARKSGKLYDTSEAIHFQTNVNVNNVSREPSGAR